MLSCDLSKDMLQKSGTIDKTWSTVQSFSLHKLMEYWNIYLDETHRLINSGIVLFAVRLLGALSAGVSSLKEFLEGYLPSRLLQDVSNPTELLPLEHFTEVSSPSCNIFGGRIIGMWLEHFWRCSKQNNHNSETLRARVGNKWPLMFQGSIV